MTVEGMGLETTKEDKEAVIGWLARGGSLPPPPEITDKLCATCRDADKAAGLAALLAAEKARAASLREALMFVRGHVDANNREAAWAAIRVALSTPASGEPSRPRRRAMEHEEMTRELFLSRFKARMIQLAPFKAFDDGTTVEEYADDAGPAYWDDLDQRAEGPEECADADMSYWGEE